MRIGATAKFVVPLVIVIVADHVRGQIQPVAQYRNVQASSYCDGGGYGDSTQRYDIDAALSFDPFIGVAATEAVAADTSGRACSDQDSQFAPNSIEASSFVSVQLFRYLPYPYSSSVAFSFFSVTFEIDEAAPYTLEGEIAAFMDPPGPGAPAGQAYLRFHRSDGVELVNELAYFHESVPISRSGNLTPGTYVLSAEAIRLGDSAGAVGAGGYASYTFTLTVGAGPGGSGATGTRSPTELAAGCLNLAGGPPPFPHERADLVSDAQRAPERTVGFESAIGPGDAVVRESGSPPIYVSLQDLPARSRLKSALPRPAPDAPTGVSANGPPPGEFIVCPSFGDCFEALGTAGCRDESCCNAVCAIDDFCCLIAWDGRCAQLAEQICQPPDCDVVCPPGAASEDEPCGDDANGGCNTPGRSLGTITCGDAVCGTCWADGGDRDTDWYEFSVDNDTQVRWTVFGRLPTTAYLLDTSCPPNFLSSVEIPDDQCPTSGTVCLEPGTYRIFVAPAVYDGYGCGSGLNEYTLALSCAESECDPPACGAAHAGDCDVSHLPPFCNDATCCDDVCKVFDFCCDFVWTAYCAWQSDRYCEANCDTVTCPPGSIEEHELCGAYLSEGCPVFGGPPQYVPISCGDTFCGTAFADFGAFDADWFEFDIPQDGTEVTWTVHAEFPVYTNFFTDDCPNSLAIATGDGLKCPSVVTTCLNAGHYTALVRPEIDNGYPCEIGEPSPYHYTVSFECNVVGACPQPQLGCGGPDAGDCYVGNLSPGCNDPACCELVCSVEPLCCEIGWAYPCVELANIYCNQGPALNDDCADAMPVGEGVIPTHTLLATTDGPPLPPACASDNGLVFLNDVWYRYTASCNGMVMVDTCGTFAIDTRLAAYEGVCGSLNLLGCNDDDIGCNTGTGRLYFEATAGNEYLIRLGSPFTTFGDGFMEIACQGAALGACCLPGQACAGATTFSNCESLAGAWQGPATDCAPDTDGDGVPDACDLCPHRIPGDVSGDGAVNTNDVAPFVSVLLDPAGASDDDRCAADVNASAAPDGNDISGFVDAILAG